MWNVVNEAFDDAGTLRNNYWYPNVGEDYVELAFQWAHQANPNAKLFYNDYGIAGLNAKSDAVYEMVKDFKQRGISIDGVGFQMHVWTGGYPDKADIAANIARLEALGVEVHRTKAQPASRKTS